MFEVKTGEIKTVSWWVDERENLDMSPEYQRAGKLWSNEDKAYLIDTILNKFDIPKIYIADFTYSNTPLNKNNKAYAVIDGKQRLETIFDFYDGTLTLSKHFKLYEDPELKLGGLGYKDLVKNHYKLARRFDNFQLSVVSVITDDSEKIQEMFVRLNRSKPLTGAEMRNAMPGPIPPVIRKFVGHEIFKYTRFSVKRGDNSNAIAKFLLFEYKKDLTDTDKKNLDLFVQQGAKGEINDANLETIKAKVKENLDIMTEVFVLRDPLLKSAGPVSLYYWFISHQPKGRRKKIREFIIEFEESRRRNKILAAENPELADEELLTYDIKSRSVDSKPSLVYRYAILQKRFNKFIGENR